MDIKEKNLRIVKAVMAFSKLQDIFENLRKTSMKAAEEENLWNLLVEESGRREMILIPFDGTPIRGIFSLAIGEKGKALGRIRFEVTGGDRPTDIWQLFFDKDGNGGEWAESGLTQFDLKNKSDVIACLVHLQDHYLNFKKV